MFRILKRLTTDNCGTSALEYGFIAAMITIGIISAVRGVADENTGLWATVENKISTAIDYEKP